MAVSQFGAPRGIRGWLAARVVARLTGEANRWMVDCLEMGPGDRFLDVGCGPGLALAAAAEVTGRAAAGVDTSPAMVRLARRRTGGQVVRADAARLPFADGAFTRAGSLNSMQFWPAPERALAELHRVLRPGGRVAVVLMARSDEPPGGGRPDWMADVEARLRAAGFTGIRVETRSFGGVVHRALLAARPERESGALLNPTADGASEGAGASIRTTYVTSTSTDQPTPTTPEVRP